MPSVVNQLEILQRQVIACTRCPRLIRYCRKVARDKRRMYMEWDYWGRPVPSFGDPEAQLLIVGLAPAAHGANRTGRMFTGDRSGDFLYRALYETGFARRPMSTHREDGLKVHDCYITASLRCAPPENKPLPQELRNCQPYFEKELELLKRVRAALVLGRIAFDTLLRILSNRPDFPPKSSFRFAHGVSFKLPLGLPHLFCSYHPSQQNTQTGRLTQAMLQKVLSDIHEHLEIETHESSRSRSGG